MSERPVVSIVTPSYNQAAFLEQTIRSVLAQDYPNIEYIVVDGGSTDGSVEIIKRYADRIARWVSEPDEGQSDAINKGFRMATGEIVAWLNSDDLYFPQTLSSAVKRFEENAALGLFYGDCVFVDRDGQFLRYFTEVEPYSAFRLRNCSDFIMQPTTFFRRDVLFDIGLLDAGLHFAMDWDLWCRFARSGCGVRYEPKLIAATRVYPATKTTAGSGPRLDEIKAVWKRYRTAWWPHAVFGFRATEAKRLLDEPGTSFCQKTWLAVRRFLLRLGNARNVLFDLFRARNLYGMRRRSNRLLRDATISLPVYSPVSTLRLTLRNRCLRRQTVSVRIGAGQPEPIELGGCNVPSTFSFAIPDQVSRSHVIDVRLQFDRANVFGVAASLDEVRVA